MSDLIIYTRKCRICRLAEQAPDVRRLVDAWLLGTAPSQEDPHIVEGEQAGGPAVADYLTRVIGKTFHRQEGPSHRRMCLTSHVDDTEQGKEGGGEEGGGGGDEEEPPAPAPPPPPKRPKRKSGYEPPTLKEAIKTGRVIQANYARLADERLVDEYLVEGLRLMRTIRRKAEGRAAAPPSMTDSLITASEAHFVLGLGLNIDKLMTLRPFVRASTMNNGLPVASTGGTSASAQVGKGDGVAGVQGLLARVRKEQADPPPIPGDSDDDPIENGRGAEILDEEARREAEEALREAEEEEEYEGESGESALWSPSAAPMMPDVGLQQGPSLPPSPDPSPAPPPPASAPQLRVVVGGGAQKPAEHSEPAWAWKPGAGGGS